VFRKIVPEMSHEKQPEFTKAVGMDYRDISTKYVKDILLNDTELSIFGAEVTYNYDAGVNLYLAVLAEVFIADPSHGR
jgi:hypothetical protein